jgi:hypothetical protein
VTRADGIPHSAGTWVRTVPGAAAVSVAGPGAHAEADIRRLSRLANGARRIMGGMVSEA